MWSQISCTGPKLRVKRQHATELVSVDFPPSFLILLETTFGILKRDLKRKDMTQPDEVKKVTNLMNYLNIVDEIENIPNASQVSNGELRYPDSEYTGEPGSSYKWVMRAYHSAKFPSMTEESIDIQDESVYWVAEEVFKSHLYNIRCAMEGMEIKEPMIVWVDFDFFKIKKHPDTEKVAVDKIDPDDVQRVKTRQFHYMRNNGLNLALSPAVQAFRFERDQFVARHGLQLKLGKLPFTNLAREVRYLIMDTKWIFEEEPFKSLEMAYFKTSSRMMAEDAKKRKLEELEELMGKDLKK